MGQRSRWIIGGLEENVEVRSAAKRIPFSGHIKVSVDYETLTR
jgi:hypothetical protein